MKKDIEIDFWYIWNIGGDNWRLTWDPASKILYAKGVISGKKTIIGECRTREEAEDLAEKVKAMPEAYFEDK